MKTIQKVKRKAVKINAVKYCDPNEILEYFKKNVKPRPHLDVVKWMEKNGR